MRRAPDLPSASRAFARAPGTAPGRVRGPETQDSLDAVPVRAHGQERSRPGSETGEPHSSRPSAGLAGPTRIGEHSPLHSPRNSLADTAGECLPEYPEAPRPWPGDARRGHRTGHCPAYPQTGIRPASASLSETGPWSQAASPEQSMVTGAGRRGEAQPPARGRGGRPSAQPLRGASRPLFSEVERRDGRGRPLARSKDRPALR